jgi:sortase A
MRRAAGWVGTLMIVAGALTLGWALLVWQWQDPFTAVYTHWQQSRLASQLDRKMREFQPATEGKSLAAIRVAVAREAARYRKSLQPGEALGRITIGSLGLKIVLVQGTDTESLKKGPGHYAASGLPGQGKLVYVAGHRTTYLAPFSHIDDLKTGDFVTVDMPYATFKYVVARHRVVAADDVSVLRSPGHEVLILQACHPRFFASHRYLVYAMPVSVTPRGGTSYAYGTDRVASGARPSGQ